MIKNTYSNSKIYNYNNDNNVDDDDDDDDDDIYNMA